MRDPAFSRQTAATSRSRDRSFEPEAVFLFEISCPEAAFLENKKLRRTMASCQRPRSAHSLYPWIVLIDVLSTKLDAMHEDSCRRFKSDRSLDQRFGMLIVLSIKLDAMHDDFMATMQILIIIWTKRSHRSSCSTSNWT